MLDAGLGPTKSDSRGCTPVHIAAARGDTSMVGLLLSAPDGPSAAATADADGATPLHCALKPNFLGGSGGLPASGSLRASTAADCVCGGDRQGVLRLLVSALAGANSAFGQAVDRAAGEQRITALMLAADAGDCDALELLLGTGQARPDVQDAAGLTALALATLRGHLHAVQASTDQGGQRHACVERLDLVTARCTTYRETLLRFGVTHAPCSPPPLLLP